MYHVGIIGCGKIAQLRHLPEYQAHADVQIVGVYDLNTDRSEEVSRKYQTHNYLSYEEMLLNPKIDAVSICTANHSHSKITIEALNAGKHVLCEKPMALTLEECETMVETSLKTGKYLMIGHNQRFLKSHMEAKKLFQSGKIGRLISFQTAFTHAGPEQWSIDAGKDTWFFDKNKAVLGAMSDLGIHKTDLIRYLTGENIVAVNAYIGTLDKKQTNGNLISVDDNAICVYKLDGGAVGVMNVGWSNYGQEDNSTILYGENGVIKLYCDPQYSLIVEKKDGSSEQYKFDQIQTNNQQTKSGIIDAFIESLQSGKEPDINGKEALLSMKAIFACIKSAKNKMEEVL